MKVYFHLLVLLIGLIASVAVAEERSHLRSKPASVRREQAALEAAQSLEATESTASLFRKLGMDCGVYGSCRAFWCCGICGHCGDKD